MKATIRQNRELVPRYFSMTLAGMGEAARGEPGQFLMVRGDWGTDPLLGRPLSICRFYPEDGEILIIYRIAGKGTLLLSQMRAGMTIDVTGPLGRPFPRPDVGRRVVLVGGAIGAPPLVALAESMDEKPLLIIGGRTENDVAFIADETKSLGIETAWVTEDGSRGERGTAVSALGGRARPGDLVYACGPNPMLAEVARLSAEVGFEAYVSLEQRMACGIGVCLGCAVRHRDGRYVHVCKDGPVFNATDIDWGSL